MAQHTISTEDARRLSRALVSFERSPQNYLPPIERKVRISASSCPNAWRIIIWGNPTGGAFEVPVTVNEITETLEFSYNCDKEGIETEFLTHSEISAG